MIPTERTVVSFWSKFFELQWKMLVSGGGNVDGESHAYASTPSEWPFLSRGIAYWVAQGSNAQIHLLGNPVLWISAAAFLFVSAGVLTIHLLCRRREIYFLSQGIQHNLPYSIVHKPISSNNIFRTPCPTGEWSSLKSQCWVCGGGYLLTFIYHFCLDRTLFLHHYLPSYVFKVLLFITMLNHLGTLAE